MRKLLNPSRLLAVAVLGLLVLGTAAAQGNGEDPIGKANQDLDRLETTLGQGTMASGDELRQFLKNATSIKAVALQCIADAQTALDKAGNDLNVLGAEVKGESSEVRSQRRSLLQQ